MSSMRCANCGQRLKEAAGWTESGPVGPVCAENLGLPRALPQVLRKNGLPRAKPVRAVTKRPALVVNANQLELEFA